MMLGFATGYRSVRDPLSSIYDLDEQSGFIVISDKDDDDHYHSRLSWLPPLCREQLQAYLQHRKAVSQHLWPVNQQSASDLDSSPVFFFLDQSFNIATVRPATLAPQLKWSFTLPLNINRHYLRTRLKSLDIAPEIIDAFMGHWDQGQEPFGRFSTLSPALRPAPLAVKGNSGVIRKRW